MMTSVNRMMASPQKLQQFGAFTFAWNSSYRSDRGTAHVELRGRLRTSRNIPNIPRITTNYDSSCCLISKFTNFQPTSDASYTTHWVVPRVPWLSRSTVLLTLRKRPGTMETPDLGNWQTIIDKSLSIIGKPVFIHH